VVEKMTGKMPDEGINPVTFPETLMTVWQAFLVLHRSRPVSMGGPLPIPESELLAYQVNRRIRLSGAEVDVLRLLDNTALENIDG
jgi:hypothetical protein